MRTDLHVLWVDDDSAKLRVVEDLLSNVTIHFAHARSVEEALDMAEDNSHIPMLLLDAILAPPKDPELIDLLMGSVSSGVLGTWEASGQSGQISSKTEPAKPIEWIFQNSYENLERGGRLFQELCRLKGITFGRVIMISYVKEQVLKEIGYEFDDYISKLDLPDYLGFLQREIEGVLQEAATK